MNILVVGGSGGIGSALVRELLNRFPSAMLTATYRRKRPSWTHERCRYLRVDVTSEDDVAALAQSLDDVDWCINAVGVLHTDTQRPEKRVTRFDSAFFLHNVHVNALPTLLLAKHLEAHFRHHRPAVFATVSAKVGSIEDNRLGGWYSYRASKAALNMLLKTLSIEWARVLPNVSVLALHPGTTDTALSKPFQKNVPPDGLFEAEYTARSLVDVLVSITPEVTGRFFAFDGEELPW